MNPRQFLQLGGVILIVLGIVGFLAPSVGSFLNFTMGENIGDLGGVSMAYRAYQLSLGGKPAPVIDGLTGDQRFFMAWAP